MKQISLLTIFLVATIIFSSCAKDDEVEIPVVKPNPSDFIVEVNNIFSFSADLEWTAATISDGSTINYDVYLDGLKIKENYVDTKIVLEELDSKTSYEGKIVAKSSNGKFTEQQYAFETKEDFAPSAFEIVIDQIATTSAKINWTEAKLPDSGVVVYDLYLDELILEEDLAAREFVLDDLDPFKDYLVKVIAKTATEKSTTQEKSFKTLGTPPSPFPLSFDEIAPAYLVVHWTEPTVADGSSISRYTIYVNNEQFGPYTINNAQYAIQGLEEGKAFTVRIIASASNNTSTEESITFTTKVYPNPSDFEISIKPVTATSMYIDWTPSTMEDGTTVNYEVYLDGTRIPGPFVHLSVPGLKVENLIPQTAYDIRVVAEENVYRKTTEREVVYTTYPIYPSITVDKAVLYTMNSTYFPGQLNVKFHQNIGSVNIVDFHAADNIDIPNFIFYPSAISSPKLSQDDYNEIDLFMKRYGYVLIKENGITYIRDFDIVVESN